MSRKDKIEHDTMELEIKTFVEEYSKEIENIGKIKELDDTVVYMCSGNYKDRFFAEYHQTRIRYLKVLKILYDYANDKIEFSPKTPIYLLKLQAETMELYLNILRKRSTIEGIDL